MTTFNPNGIAFANNLLEAINTKLDTYKYTEAALRDAKESGYITLDVGNRRLTIFEDDEAFAGIINQLKQQNISLAVELSKYNTTLRDANAMLLFTADEFGDKGIAAMTADDLFKTEE